MPIESSPSEKKKVEDDKEKEEAKKMFPFRLRVYEKYPSKINDSIKKLPYQKK